MSQIYANFNFKLFWRNRMVAGFNQLSGLKPTGSRTFFEYLDQEPIHRQETGEPEFATLTLMLGVSADREFYTWANEWFTQTFSSLNNLHPDDHWHEDVIIEMTGEDGKTVRAYHVSRARITDSIFAGDPAGDDQPLAFEKISLYNEGWSLV